MSIHHVSIPFTSGHSFQQTGRIFGLMPHPEVSIPFTSGHSFQLGTAPYRFSIGLGLNPLYIGSLFPTNTSNGRKVLHIMSQSPLHRVTLSNEIFLTISKLMIEVSIPFTSGHSFQPFGAKFMAVVLRSLNPLYIGSLFPTYPLLKPCVSRLWRVKSRNLYFVMVKLTFVNSILSFFEC